MPNNCASVGRLGRVIGFACALLVAPAALEAQTLPRDAPAVSQFDPLIEQPITIPSDVPGPFGTRRYMLEALLVRPPADRKLPLALITHGTPREGADRRKMKIANFSLIARDFARRGWVAVVVMRRGHGASEGEYEEGMRCANPDYVHSGRMAVYDLKSAVRYLSEQSYVDASRVIGVGQSTGGFSWLATSADAPPNLVAVINFAGGHGSLRPRENCSEGQMLVAMRTFGAGSRIPSLWIYAENDSYVVPDLARRMHGAFVSAGAPAELAMVPAFEDDGHALLYRAAGVYIWTPLVDAFLRKHALPTWAPEDMRGELVPPSRQANYRRYLAAHAEKAFALALDGSYSSYWSGVASIGAARQHALTDCEAGVRKCRTFAVNFGVVPAVP
jgi:dienelactone hydrolase